MAFRCFIHHCIDVGTNFLIYRFKRFCGMVVSRDSYLSFLPLKLNYKNPYIRSWIWDASIQKYNFSNVAACSIFLGFITWFSSMMWKLGFINRTYMALKIILCVKRNKSCWSFAAQCLFQLETAAICKYRSFFFFAEMYYRNVRFAFHSDTVEFEMNPLSNFNRCVTLSSHAISLKLLWGS